ncbi:MAG: hypothetical protein SFX73_08470 [Kofleriaceae bacterium]|nr:hypothetical protein [Kofleriaceae bacterium]
MELRAQATAVDLPGGRRLVLLRGGVSGPSGRVAFVGARLLPREQVPDGEGSPAGSFEMAKEAATMTDKELSSFGERLYEAVLFTPLPAATVFNLALAVRGAVPWAQLPQHLKFAVFKIAASCVADDEAASAEPAPSGEAPVHETPTPPPITGSVLPSEPAAPEEDERVPMSANDLGAA